MFMIIHFLGSTKIPIFVIIFSSESKKLVLIQVAVSDVLEIFEHKKGLENCLYCWHFSILTNNKILQKRSQTTLHTSILKALLYPYFEKLPIIRLEKLRYSTKTSAQRSRAVLAFQILEG